MALFSMTARGEFDTGTDEVVLVAGPDVGVRIVTMIRLSNLDSASLTPAIRVRYADPTDRDEYVKVIPDLVLGAGKFREIAGPFEVLRPGEDLVVNLAAAPTTTNPTWTSIWIEER